MTESEKYSYRNVECRLPPLSLTTERGRYLSLLSLSLLTLHGSGVTPAQLWLGGRV